ncbi:RNA-binding protein [Vagococcus salmoninarum]|uniref:RNA-binding protein n=1 Tax=Vagococcus salmoninarum TaxID=2739 RepID=A0A429ZLI1_9ENTE|nr:RNA-binding protein [Vagococcus salmoninarum]MBE9388807.1 RNA-binding protein [Vagococcus salmoninarum]RST94564.1 RNA-binding protein [Vagococcus salmoninarum]
MNANVYQHFRKDEHPFVDMIGGWIEQVESQYAPYLTDFLDPRQAFILESIIGSDSELVYSFYGGYESAERRRALIYPAYYEPTEEDYQVELYEIQYPVKFGSLSHGKILGTLLSSGIRREFFGDIISDGERWQFFINHEVANFVISQLDKIGSMSVKVKQINYTDILVAKDSWEFETDTVTSLRVDNIISAVFNISRQRSKLLVDSGKVKVNWVEIQRSDFMLALLDIISIRGFGRIQLRTIEGKTKKDKHRVQLAVLRK